MRFELNAPGRRGADRSLLAALLVAAGLAAGCVAGSYDHPADAVTSDVGPYREIVPGDFRTRAILSAIVTVGQDLAGDWNANRAGAASDDYHFDVSRLHPDNAKRDQDCMTRLFLDTVAARPGETVADLGAGAGYFTFKFARQVGSTGRVIATENSRPLVRDIRAYAAGHHVDNVRAVHVVADDPGLRGHVDAVAMFNLHSFCAAEPTRRFFQALREQVPAAARIVFWTDRVRTAGPDSDTCQLPLDEMRQALAGVYRIDVLERPEWCRAAPSVNGFLAILRPW